RARVPKGDIVVHAGDSGGARGTMNAVSSKEPTRRATPFVDETQKRPEDSLPEGRGPLRLIISSEAGVEVVPLRREGALALGRDPSCAIVIADASVSREHAILHLPSLELED